MKTVQKIKNKVDIPTVYILIGWPLIIMGYCLHKIFVLLKVGWIISRDFDGKGDN